MRSYEGVSASAMLDGLAKVCTWCREVFLLARALTVRCSQSVPRFPPGSLRCQQDPRQHQQAW
eukprot:12996601-Alexandrium_andersonii.AAC.1